MVVHFYEIRGCTLDKVDNRPVLVATENLLVDMLAYYEFVLLEDGRWVHFLTPEEYAHVMKGYPKHDVVFLHPYTCPPMVQSSPEEMARGDRCAKIGVWLVIASVVLLIVIAYIWIGRDTLGLDSQIAYLFILPIITQIAAFILALYTRMRYPDNKLGKTMMMFVIVEMILVALVVFSIYLVFVVACNACWDMLDACE